MHPLIPDITGLSTDELLIKVNELQKKLNMIYRTGNTALVGQMKMVIDHYQQEYQKRIAAEVQQAKENPIFKDSLDIG